MFFFLIVEMTVYKTKNDSKTYIKTHTHTKYKLDILNLKKNDLIDFNNIFVSFRVVFFVLIKYLKEQKNK